jgi:hypothetical protein
MKKLFIAITFLVLSSSYTAAAQETGEDNFGTWLTYFGNHRIAENWSVFTELQYNYNQFWYFLGLNYRIDERSSVSAGYAYFNADPSYTEIPGEEIAQEHRTYEQFGTRSSIGKFNLFHRYRLEQRFFNGNPTVKHRMRYRILLTHPIKGALFAQTFDEVFINFQQPTFNQNRIFLGMGYRFSKTINLRAGYLKVHFTNTKYDRLQVFLNINTDLRSKEKEHNPSLP